MNKFNVLNTVKNIVKSKTIRICSPFEANFTKFSETFNIGNYALDEVRYLIESKLSSSNEDQKILIELYNELIGIEEMAFQGSIINFREDSIEKTQFLTLYHRYEDILKKIKEVPSNAILIDNTGRNLISYFNPANIQKISDTIKDLAVQNNILKIKDLSGIEFANAFIKYFNLSNKKIYYDASDLFGDSSLANYFDIYVMQGEVCDMEDIIDENLESIRKIKKTFKDINISFFIDGAEMELSKVDNYILEDIKRMVISNVIVYAKEMVEDIECEGYRCTDDYPVLFQDVIDRHFGDKTELKTASKQLHEQLNKIKQAETLKQEQKQVSNAEIENIIESKFKNVIGLKDVKQELKDMIKFCNKLKSINKFTMEHNHMCFVGKPGTGKTMTARLVAEVLNEAGFLNSKKFSEVNAISLQGEYLGQTAPKVQDIIDKASGGVLFIDEAYQLIDSARDDDSYGKEAIATLIKNMEDKKDLMVIFAGYEGPTKKMIETNPGLASRISSTIRFTDYSTDELVEIAKIQANKNGFTFDKNFVDALKEYINNEKTKNNFANARCVRNIVEMAEKMQSRRSEMDDFTLTKEDINLAIAKQNKFQLESFDASTNDLNFEANRKADSYLIAMKAQEQANRRLAEEERKNKPKHLGFGPATNE